MVCFSRIFAAVGEVGLELEVEVEVEMMGEVVGSGKDKVELVDDAAAGEVWAIA